MYYPKDSEHTIIPAQPNWFVAWPWKEDGKQGVALDAIIAWLIVHSVSDYHAKASPVEKVVTAHAYPITSEDVLDDGEWCLKDPGGHFLIANERTFDNEADLLAYWPEFKEAEAPPPSPAAA
jgi:hypothetical protein